ncbi:hypothetical protein RCL_jg22648.t1 [Rhizophagus clarus]|uniref:Uncharacterized protein n=1 Tax=Rhizophagus clarus TaxID=94130 RepID=A0A8H3ME69_9GLOM|nr:hypothetical protein RCL_jg22648.t1 [Rhizophagus clarus]
MWSKVIQEIRLRPIKQQKIFYISQDYKQIITLFSKELIIFKEIHESTLKLINIMHNYFIITEILLNEKNEITNEQKSCTNEHSNSIFNFLKSSIFKKINETLFNKKKKIINEQQTYTNERSKSVFDFLKSLIVKKITKSLPAYFIKWNTYERQTCANEHSDSIFKKIINILPEIKKIINEQQTYINGRLIFLKSLIVKKITKLLLAYLIKFIFNKKKITCKSANKHSVSEIKQITQPKNEEILSKGPQNNDPDEMKPVL